MKNGILITQLEYITMHQHLVIDNWPSIIEILFYWTAVSMNLNFDFGKLQNFDFIELQHLSILNLDFSEFSTSWTSFVEIANHWECLAQILHQQQSMHCLCLVGSAIYQTIPWCPIYLYLVQFFLFESFSPSKKSWIWLKTNKNVFLGSYTVERDGWGEKCEFHYVYQWCRIIVPPELGYPENDYNKSGPRPTTFSVRV